MCCSCIQIKKYISAGRHGPFKDFYIYYIYFSWLPAVIFFYVVELDGDVGVEFPKNKDKLLGTAMPQHDFPKDFALHLLYLFFHGCRQVFIFYVLSSRNSLMKKSLNGPRLPADVYIHVLSSRNS